MQKGRSFEKQIEKVIEYIEKLGFHGHKNYEKRTEEGLYLEGECFDYEIFLPTRHDCFDAKQCKTDTWHIVKKDLKQTNELKKCKNAGCNAYFLVCFEDNDVRQIDVDIVINYLKQNKKSIKKYGLPSWELIENIKNKGVNKIWKQKI